MSATNSPYQKSGMLPSTCTPNVISAGFTPTIGSFNDHIFEHQLGMPETGTYDFDFQSFFVTSASESSLINPSIAHLTPLSEPSSDFHEAITPLSLQPPFVFHSASRPQPVLSSINTSIEAPASRPRSSPGSFSQKAPNAPNHWINESPAARDNGLGILISPARPTPAPSPKPRHQTSVSSVSDVFSPPQARQWTPIAPHPASIIQMQAGIKRAHSDDDFEHSPVSKRKRSAPSSPSPNANLEMNPENQLLLRLREEENLSWKEIQMRFETELGKSYRIATLQMRLTRLRERMRTWTDVDVHALRLAHEYWMTHKFDIIASKMADCGATEKWTNKQCYKKWQDIGFASETIFAHFHQTPSFAQSYSSSPIDEHTQAFYPMAATSAS